MEINETLTSLSEDDKSIILLTKQVIKMAIEKSKVAQDINWLNAILAGYGYSCKNFEEFYVYYALTMSDKNKEWYLDGTYCCLPDFKLNPYFFDINDSVEPDYDYNCFYALVDLAKTSIVSDQWDKLIKFYSSGAKLKKYDLVKEFLIDVLLGDNEELLLDDYNLNYLSPKLIENWIDQGSVNTLFDLIRNKLNIQGYDNKLYCEFGLHQDSKSFDYSDKENDSSTIDLAIDLLNKYVEGVFTIEHIVEKYNL